MIMEKTFKELWNALIEKIEKHNNPNNQQQTTNNN